MVPRRHSHRRAGWPLLGLGLGGGGVVVVVIAVVIGMSQMAGGRACAAVISASGSVAGTATHYVLSGIGNCSYLSPPDGLYVALSPSEYDTAAACGGYVDVRGPKGSVRAEVIDQCPPCADGHIDLSEAAFSRIAPLSAGLVPVTYRAVADPPLPAPVSLEVQKGSSAYWLSLLAANTGNPLASVEVESASAGWRNLARANYNYWIASSGAGGGPFTVRLTDTAGHQVTVRGVALEPGVIQNTGIQMYGAGTVTVPALAAPVTTAGASPSSAAARRQRTRVPKATISATVRIPSQAPATRTRVPLTPATPSC